MQRIVREPDIYVVRSTIGGQFDGGLVVERADALAAGPNPTAVLEAFSWLPP
jgi:hypothetical protein